MGKPRKVVDLSTRRIGKKERLNRKIQEQKIKLDRDQLENDTPEWLSDDAKAEYMRVVKEAGKIELLDNLDLTFLAMYADAWDRYTNACKQMLKYGSVVKTGTAITPSPFLAVADKAANTIMKCSTKLGLSTTDRLKLIVPTKEEKSVNKFLKFLDA